jgi:hypothetical protein
MSPKRKSPTEVDANGPVSHKKAKGSEDSDASTEPDPSPAPAAAEKIIQAYKTHWSAVSASKNLAGEWTSLLQKRRTTDSFKWITICPCYGTGFSDDDHDDDEPDDGDAIPPSPLPVCRTSSCLCSKSPDDHADYPWIITCAGMNLLSAQFVMADLRDPDNFNMYTFNDHAAYGIIEVVENLVFAFTMANQAGESREDLLTRWAIIEATALFLFSPRGQEAMNVEDANRLRETVDLVGFMFLRMLSLLKSNDLLKDDSDIRNLGLIMSLFVKLPGFYEDEDLDDERTTEGKFKADPNSVADYILAYAKENNVTLKGVKNFKTLTAKMNEGIAMPDAAKDPWQWHARLQEHAKSHGKGGDALDITTWTSAKRKQKAFDNKDPLGKSERDAIKQGLIFQLV